MKTKFRKYPFPFFSLFSLLFALCSFSSCGLSSEYASFPEIPGTWEYPDPSGNQPSGPSNNVRTGNEGLWYQIFTIAFYDSDGDGKGDLQGIIQNLDYLNDSHKHPANPPDGWECNDSLHVDGIWLTPIMKATSYHKYDTIDYMVVDPDFGTEDDIKALVAACHERGMKIIVDLAVNHSGAGHSWFQSALAGWRSGNLGPYASYYEIKAQDNSPGDGWHHSWNTGTDTNNGTAANGKQIWFYGSFGPWMPDFNWNGNNPVVMQRFDEINKHWIAGIGIDGYRLDATKHIFENGRFNGDTDKNIAFWTQFAINVRKHNPNAYMVGECLDSPDTVLYYHKPGMGSFALDFANDYGRIAGAALWGRGRNFAEGVLWMTREVKNLHPLATFAPFLSNHDFDRSSNWLEWDDQRKMAASLLLLCPGTPFMYYGEEIGLVGYKVPGDEMVRGPMIFSMADDTGRPDSSQWGMNVGAVTIPGKPEQGLPAWKDYLGPNDHGGGFIEQLDDPASLLRHYIRIQNLKNKYPWIAYGKTDAEGIDVDMQGHVAAYRVTDDDPDSETYGKSVVIAHNVLREHGSAAHGYIRVPNARGFDANAIPDQWISAPIVPGGNPGEYWIRPYCTVIFREWE